jgi:Tfp pilus assembly protein PilF
MDAAQLNVIYRKYGDNLYQKGNYDGAMQQYLKAIDNTEPSQVIRKASQLSCQMAKTNFSSSLIPKEYTT